MEKFETTSNLSKEDKSLINNKDLLKKVMEQSLISGHRPAQMHQKQCIQIVNKKAINGTFS